MHDILLPLNYYVLFIIFIYLDMQVSNTISISNIIRVVNSNSMAATSGAGTTYPSGAHAFIPIFSVVHVAQTSAHCVVFCKSFSFCFLVLFLLAIVFSVLLRFTASDYPFGIFKIFLCQLYHKI
jgi:hypothetical protein